MADNKLPARDVRNAREFLLAGTPLTLSVIVGAAAVRNSDALSVLVMLASITLVVTGWLLRRDVDHNRAGLLLYSAAVFLSLSDSASAFGPAADVVANITSLWSVPPLGWVLLTYPGRTPTRRWHAWLLAVVAAEFLVLWPAEWLIRRAMSPPGMVSAVLEALLYYGGVPLPILACVALAQRWREAARPERPAVRSVTVVGLALCSTFALRLVAFAFADSGAMAAAVHEFARVLNLVCLGVAPVGLLLETIRRRTVQRKTLEDLLGASGDAPRVQACMARALHDPTLRLAFGMGGGPVQFIAPPTSAPSTSSGEPAPGRLIRELRSSGGELVGVVDADASTASDPAQLRVVLAGASIALTNTRLQASLLGSLEELRRSRARIVEAEERARRLLERDLHDGAQQQLLTVAATLARAEILPDTASRDRAVAEARAQLAGAVSELRRLARGIHPAALSRGGLAVALPTLADSAPLPIDLDIPVELRDVRLPMLVETTLWFVAAEAMTNSVRHSGAKRIRLRLRVEHDLARLRIEDDGRGGAHMVPGGGLAGLTDRVAALGGALVLGSRPPSGTVLEVVLPCAP